MNLTGELLGGQTQPEHCDQWLYVQVEAVKTGVPQGSVFAAPLSVTQTMRSSAPSTSLEII